MLMMVESEAKHDVLLALQSIMITHRWNPIPWRSSPDL
jgi:hypothetical protein